MAVEPLRPPQRNERYKVERRGDEETGYIPDSSHWSLHLTCVR
jgi:hypothetical protein